MIQHHAFLLYIFFLLQLLLFNFNIKIFCAIRHLAFLLLKNVIDVDDEDKKTVYSIAEQNKGWNYQVNITSRFDEKT